MGKEIIGAVIFAVGILFGAALRIPSGSKKEEKD